MSLFKQKLKDIHDLIKANKLEEARDVLDQHIKDEHDVESDLAGLQGAISTLRDTLVAVRKDLVKMIENPRKNLKINRYRLKDEAIGAEVEVDRIQALIRKLQIDGRIKLK